jgi:hypothetical protein
MDFIDKVNSVRKVKCAHCASLILYLFICNCFLLDTCGLLYLRFLLPSMIKVEGVMHTAHFIGRLFMQSVCVGCARVRVHLCSYVMTSITSITERS